MRNNYIGVQWICCTFAGLNPSWIQQVFLRLPQLFPHGLDPFFFSSLPLWCSQLSHVPSAVSAWPPCLSKDLHVLRLVLLLQFATVGTSPACPAGTEPSSPLLSSDTSACSPHCILQNFCNGFETSAFQTCLKSGGGVQRHLGRLGKDKTAQS